MNDRPKETLGSAASALLTTLETSRVLEEMNGVDEDFLFAAGFEEAILGYAQVFNQTVVLYDKQKCLQILMERDGGSLEDVTEHFDYNVVGAYAGERTPAFATILRKP